MPGVFRTDIARKRFFFEKKNQKTFATALAGERCGKSSCFFFQKEALPCLALVTFAALPAAAMTPLLAPTRDVTVEYEVAPAGRAPLGVRVAIEAGGQHLRITSPELPTTFLVDRGAGMAQIVLPLLRAYTDMKIAKFDPQRTVLRGAHFTRGGSARVAGRDCVNWHAESSQGTADACITDDGVIMRGAANSARRGNLGQLVASRVIYGTVPQAAFEVPPDFQHSPFPLTGGDDGK